MIDNREGAIREKRGIYVGEYGRNDCPLICFTIQNWNFRRRMKRISDAERTYTHHVRRDAETSSFNGSF